MPSLAVADAAHGGQVGVKVAACAQLANFVQKALCQHDVKALSNTMVQPGPVVGLQREPERAFLAGEGFAALAKKRGQRSPRQLPHLQGTADALGIAGRKARGRRGVDACKLRMQGWPAQGVRLRFDGRANRRIGLGQIIQPFEQGFEIQQGAAHQHGQLATLADGRHQVLCIARKVGGVVGLCRVANVQQVVRHGGALLRAGFRGANVHITVDQGGIHADDFNRPALRQCQ